MRRVTPSRIVREEIGQLLAGGVEQGTNILSALADLGLRYVAQQALEQEQADHLGRDRYERADSRDGATGARTPECERPRGRSVCASPKSAERKCRTGPS